MMGSEQTVDELKAEYLDLLHAMQSGVRAEIELTEPAAAHGTLSHSPKHLRVGINSALTQCSSLATLLIEKGVVTELEYWRAQVSGFRDEVARFEQKLSEQFGAKVSLR